MNPEAEPKRGTKARSGNTPPRTVWAGPPPWDVVAILIWLAATYATISIQDGSILRVLLGVPVVIFLPGYAAVRAIFPHVATLQPLERIGFSLIVSVSISGLVGLVVLNAPILGIRTDTVLIANVVITTALLLVSLLRQRGLAEEERYTVRSGAIASAADAACFREKGSSGKRWVGLGLAFGVVILCLFSFVPLTVKGGERFTEFFVVEQPDDFTQFDATHTLARPINLTVANQEGREVTYRIEGWSIPEAAAQGANLAEGVDGSPLGTLKVTVPADERRQVQFPAQVALSTQDRIYFLLYRDDAPTMDGDLRTRVEQAHLHLFLRLRNAPVV